MSAAIASLAPADNCFDCRVYRAIELGPIGDPDDLKLPFHGDYTFGINNLGEVVWFGFVELESPCSGWAIRAYVRLPVPNYGLPAGTYQLTIPSGTSACIPVTAACDINDAGYIAGSVGGTLEYDPQTEQRAVVWRLDQATSGSPATIPPAIIAPSELALDEEDFEVGCWSHVHGLNNSSPPEAVGVVTVDPCEGGCHYTNLFFGFRLEFGSNDPPTGLPPSVDSLWSMAFAVSDQTQPTIVGRDRLSGNLCSPSAEPTHCNQSNNSADGLAWDLSGAQLAELAELGLSSNNQGETYARDVDAQGHIVGMSRLPVGGTCVPFATLWEDALASMSLELSGICGDPVQSRADSIVAVGGELVLVCGTTGTRGLLWHRVDDAWCCNVVPEITFRPAGGPSGDADIWAAHAISIDGYIVAHGFGSGSEVHAFLLTCAADLSGDLRVDGADLGMLMSAWGPGDRSEDLDESGAVDSVDVGLLLGAWTEETERCRIQCLDSPETSQFAEAMTVLAAVQSLGFPEMEDFVAWCLEATREQLDAAAATLHSLIHALQ